MNISTVLINLSTSRSASIPVILVEKVFRNTSVSGPLCILLVSY